MLELTNDQEMTLTEQAVVAPRQPLLSFAISGRNDGYMGDFNWRIETALNYMAENVDRLGRLDDVEVVITDWGSDVPLHAVLSLEEPARKITRLVYVPPALARDLQGDSEFPSVLAVNAAIRRSSGHYIALTNSDILIPAVFLRQLFAMLDGEQAIRVPIEASILFAPQYQVPWWYVNRNPKVDEMDFILNHIGDHLPMEPLGSLGPFVPAGFIIMPRRLWYECHGLDERLIYWGFSDADLSLRVTQKYSGFDLSKLGMCVFHLEHYPHNNRNLLARKRNPQVWDNPFAVNDAQWGLATHRLEEFTCSLDSLDSVNCPPFPLHPSFLPRSLRIFFLMGLLLLTAYRPRLVRLMRTWMMTTRGRVKNVRVVWLHRARRLNQEIRSRPLWESPAVVCKLWLEWRRKRGTS